MARKHSKRIGIGLGIIATVILVSMINPIDGVVADIDFMTREGIIPVTVKIRSNTECEKLFAFTFFPVIPYIRERLMRNKDSQDHIIRLAADKQYSYEYRAFIIDLATRDPEQHALDSRYGRLIFHTIITDKHEHERLREYALLKIREQHNVDIPFARIVKDHTEPIRVRCAALAALGRTNHEAFRQLLFKIMKGHARYNTEIIRHALVCADKNLGFIQSLDDLKAVIREARDQEMYDRILHALGHISGENSVRTMIELVDLAQSEDQLKIRVSMALLRTALMNHEKDIISLLRSTSEYDRTLGARAAKLGNIRSALSLIDESRTQSAD